MSALLPKADIAARQLNVRFVPEADVGRSFEHIIGASEHRGRNGQPQLFCGLQVDGQIEFGRLFDWKVAWFCAAQDFIDIIGSTAEKIRNVWGV